MEDIQQIIVNEHIDDLRHDAEARRLRDPSGDDDPGTARTPAAWRSPARVRSGSG